MPFPRKIGTDSGECEVPSEGLELPFREIRVRTPQANSRLTYDKLLNPASQCRHCSANRERQAVEVLYFDDQPSAHRRARLMRQKKSKAHNVPALPPVKGAQEEICLPVLENLSPVQIGQDIKSLPSPCPIWGNNPIIEQHR